MKRPRPHRVPTASPTQSKSLRPASRPLGRDADADRRHHPKPPNDRVPRDAVKNTPEQEPQIVNPPPVTVSPDTSSNTTMTPHQLPRPLSRPPFVSGHLNVGATSW